MGSVQDFGHVNWQAVAAASLLLHAGAMARYSRHRAGMLLYGRRGQRLGCCYEIVTSERVPVAAECVRRTGGGGSVPARRREDPEVSH